MKSILWVTGFFVGRFLLFVCFVVCQHFKEGPAFLCPQFLMRSQWYSNWCFLHVKYLFFLLVFFPDCFQFFLCNFCVLSVFLWSFGNCALPFFQLCSSSSPESFSLYCFLKSINNFSRIDPCFTYKIVSLEGLCHNHIKKGIANNLLLLQPSFCDHGCPYTWQVWYDITLLFYLA